MVLTVTYGARHYSYIKVWTEERRVAEGTMRLHELKLMEKE